MKITSFTDYSLRVLIFLAINEEEKATVTQISNSYEISNNHLVKVVHNLSKIGLVSSYKGRNGGLCLAIDPQKINIGKLVMSLEEDIPLVECFDERGKCKINANCKLKSALARARKSFYQVLGEYTLKDIITNKRSLQADLLLGH